MARELEVALEAATAAGQMLSENFGREQAVRFKGEVDLVTEVDERAERVIREVLLGAFPAYGVLGEEGGWSRGGGGEGARWIVDPLDGTTNYAHGLPLFCVYIALERSGEVVLGVVHDPTAEETYAAESGGGAELNGRPLRVSDTGEPIRALVGSGLPYEREHLPAALELFGRLAALTQGTRRLGSVALALCYVAAGRLDGYYERGPKASWDVAAGALLVEEAGGRVTDYRGDKLDLGGGEVAASNGGLHPFLVGETGAGDR